MGTRVIDPGAAEAGGQRGPGAVGEGETVNSQWLRVLEGAEGESAAGQIDATADAVPVSW